MVLDYDRRVSVYEQSVFATSPSPPADNETSRRKAFADHGRERRSVMGMHIQTDRKVSQDELEPDVDTCLKLTNYEDTVRQLDIYYGMVKRQLLRYQSPTTGLFPVHSGDNKVAHVRDSVYCAAAVWSLYQAYRRIDDDRGKSYELGQSAVKCMRGILTIWIKHSSKLQEFKKKQSPRHALHSFFHLVTGEELYKDTHHGHLQIDVVSLFLLFLVQMITSGLQIVYTMDEVAFVQNLVYYVERAYRTPDYGPWERGSKYNDGSLEIHASTIGMAKAALEAINGCNMFGEKGASWSVIYVDIDAHNRNRNIFETLLPRESSSKNIDSSLIPTISFPAFATHDENLYSRTKNKVVNKLKGRYGFKRFLRDGYMTVLEDKNRVFYHEGETKNFENIECEWPIFAVFMIIDGVFKGLQDQVEEYRKFLKNTLKVDAYGDPILPKYYYVPKETTEYEKKEPRSQLRISSQEGNPGNLYMWGQAVLIISELLTNKLLYINELDLIRRYLPSYNRPRRGGRYSAFQGHFFGIKGTASDLVVQVVLIAESMRLQAMMATYGIQTQTPHEVEPVQIWSPGELVKVYEHLGVNKKLNLKGRPTRPIGALGTSKIYRVCGQTVLCYPLIFEVSDFYLSHDMALLIDDIKTELHFVGRCWRLSGRPTVCILIREDHMRDPMFKQMLDLLAMLKKGYCDGLKVRTGRLQNLISSSCVEHLDFMNLVDASDLQVHPFTQLQHEYIGYQSLTDVPKAVAYSEKYHSFKEFQFKPTWEVIQVMKLTETLYGQAQLLGILLKREGEHFLIDGVSVKELIEKLNRQAGSLRQWAAVRYCSGILCKIVDSISPYITAVLVNGKQVSIGVIGHEEVVFDKPMTPAEIHEVIYTKVQPYDAIQAVLQQEVILYSGKLIATNLELFTGILKIRAGWVLHAMKLYKRMTMENPEPLESLSPSDVRHLLQKILSMKDWANEENLNMYQRRQLEGCLGRVPESFYQNMWNILGKTPEGITLQGHHLPQQPTLSFMTLAELNFAHMVEEMMNKVSHPEYKQIVVELLCIVATILKRNPELSFRDQLDVDKLISEAFRMFLKDMGQDKSDDMTPFYNAPTFTTSGYLARAVVNSVLTGDIGSLLSRKDEEKVEMCQVS